MEAQAQTTDQFNLNAFVNARKELRDHVNDAFTKVKDTKKYDRKDIIRLLSKLVELVSTVDNFSDIVISDMMTVDNRLNLIESRILMVGQSVATIRQALVDKQTLSDEEIMAAWENKIKPEIEAKLKEVTKKNEPSGLVDTSGNAL
jgi:hypothetical protein